MNFFVKVQCYLRRFHQKFFAPSPLTPELHLIILKGEEIIVAYDKEKEYCSHPFRMVVPSNVTPSTIANELYKEAKRVLHAETPDCLPPPRYLLKYRIGGNENPTNRLIYLYIINLSSNVGLCTKCPEWIRFFSYQELTERVHLEKHFLQELSYLNSTLLLTNRLLKKRELPERETSQTPL